jgi:hypothetical protein
MGGRQIVLVSTAGFSVLNTGIFWQQAKTKRLFYILQCIVKNNNLLNVNIFPYLGATHIIDFGPAV